MEFVTGDQLCDSCMHAQVTCMWPTTGSLQQGCFGCQRSHGKCEISGTSVMAWALCQFGVHKKCEVVSKVTIKEGDDAMWVLPPAPKVVRMAESLFEKALAGIMKEMKVSWKSLERIAWDALEVLWEMLS